MTTPRTLLDEIYDSIREFQIAWKPTEPVRLTERQIAQVKALSGPPYSASSLGAETLFGVPVMRVESYWASTPAELHLKSLFGEPE